MSGELEVIDLHKAYDGAVALSGVSLHAKAGEFLTLLGPSGSGKTTTLHIVAGFIHPDSGSVILDGRPLADVPPYRRNIGVVFQHYALFPHMSVEKNVAFPLEARGMRPREVRQHVAVALETVGLTGLEHRRPPQLSGGQQQRVALARAIVFHPPLLLMDEPLGALDKKLRERLQLEIARISRQLGVTVIYVTHDQEEALVMSNRIAVYNGGRIDQVGSPQELYERPNSLFVADFLGESNILHGELAGTGPECHVRVGRAAIRVHPNGLGNCQRGDRVAVLIRPENLNILPEGARAPDGSGAAWSGRGSEVIYLGSIRKLVIDAEGDRTLLARVGMDEQAAKMRPGDRVLAWASVDHCVVVRADAAADKDRTL